MANKATFRSVLERSLRVWKPPPRLSLSEWADREFVLSAESAAEPGRWKCIPYQREPLDCFTDPRVEQISMMKSARIGWTKMIDIVIASCIAQNPCPIMVVQPTIEDAEGFSKEEFEPMNRDVPAVAAVIDPDDRSQTMTHKVFRGGSVTFVGANSGRGFRRVSRKIVLFDETDGYPPSAGEEGDQIKLGIKRTEYYWDRKIAAGSTPLLAGTSRIEKLFEDGDQRRYHVPCPQCGHMAPLVFREPKADDDGAVRGHVMKWPKDKPEEAFFACGKNGCVIEHHDKRWMVERGKWVAAKPFNGHASFHIWAAYSYSPNATWGKIAKEFVDATKKNDTEALKTFVNTTLGETWHDRGEAPDWERLYERREKYARGIVPAQAVLLTAGVDVQKDRLIFEVVAWARDLQSWSVEIGVIPGDPSGDEVWYKIDELLSKQWPGVDGSVHMIGMLAVDSGDNTNAVYTWARRHPMNRVIAVKGQSGAKAIIGSPTSVDVNIAGRRLARGYKMWPVGSDIAKGELYGQLRLKKPTEESGLPYPPGYCHFPEYGEDFFKQITAEHLVTVVNRRGFSVREWQVLPGRENHFLDCRVYARAAAMLAGLDRYAASRPPPDAPAPAPAPAPPPAPSARDGGRPEAPESTPVRPGAPGTARGTWLRGSRGALGSGRGSWLRRT